MIDFPFILRVKLPVVDRIQRKSNKFALSVENKATEVTQNSTTALKLSDSKNKMRLYNVDVSTVNVCASTWQILLSIKSDNK